MRDLADELLVLEHTLAVLVRATGHAVYDFNFPLHFDNRHPYEPLGGVCTVARVGAIADYPAFYDKCREWGCALVHDPEQHRRAVELPRWYPALESLTPRSLWFEGEPDIDAVERELGWPVFVKGARQTHHHTRRSIVSSRDEMAAFLEHARRDPILGWQQLVFRQHEELRVVEDHRPERVPAAFEFRTVWWRGHLVSWGRYWFDVSPYSCTPSEERQMLAVASEAAERLDLPFATIDVAQRADGRWIVIECNDGQESGFNGMSHHAIWRRVLDIESSAGR